MDGGRDDHNAAAADDDGGGGGDDDDDNGTSSVLTFFSMSMTCSGVGREDRSRSSASVFSLCISSAPTALTCSATATNQCVHLQVELLYLQTAALPLGLA